MRDEIEFFREQLHPKSEVLWESPLALIIPRTPSAVVYGDSCLHGAGGFSTDLKFWWHIEFPEEIKLRTLLHMKDNADGNLISINVLEYVTVIINYCATLHMVSTTAPTKDPHPVVLNITDNKSALSWTTHACKKSKTGRLLARVFCSFLMNSPLGITSKWISTNENKIADDISRQKLQANLDSPAVIPSYDYTLLQQKYPELKACSFFQIEPAITSLLWETILTANWPSHEAIQILKRKPLGRLII